MFKNENMKGHVFPEAGLESKNRRWMSKAVSSQLQMTEQYWEFLPKNPTFYLSDHLISKTYLYQYQ